jgi:hypothetical protein
MMQTQNYQDMALKAATQAGIDPSIFMGLIDSESSWNPAAVNGSAVGLGQVLPSTASNPGYGVSPNVAALTDPQENLNFSAYLLAGYQDYSGGDINKALSMYKGYGGALDDSAMVKINQVYDKAGNYAPGSATDTGADSWTKYLPDSLKSSLGLNEDTPAGQAKQLNDGSSNPAGSTQTKGKVSVGDTTASNTKAIWQYTWGDLKNSLSGSLLSVTVGLLGLLILLATVYTLVSRSGDIASGVAAGAGVDPKMLKGVV